MWEIKPHEQQVFQQKAEEKLIVDLASWLRKEWTGYVEDLSDDELLKLTSTITDEADKLGIDDLHSIRAFAAASSIYGAYSHCDPIFEEIYYTILPFGNARRLKSADGIWSGLASVLNIEFKNRSGLQLVSDFESAFNKSDFPFFSSEEIFNVHFPERYARLPKDRLDDHVQLSHKEARRAGFSKPYALNMHRLAALILGAAFTRDPLYPWAQIALNHENEERRCSRLRAAFLKIISRFNTQLKEGGHHVS